MNSKNTREMALEKLTKGDYAGGFEAIYAYTQQTHNIPPWAHMEATPDFVEWAEREALSGEGKHALVVGCGMGDDAEYLARLGFDVVAFDVSKSAIGICKTRFPDSSVEYHVADLFRTSNDWQQAYDFVLENRTIQALPNQWYKKTIATIANFVAEDGRILVLCRGREPEQAKDSISIPWHVSRAELQCFIENGLSEVQFEEFEKNGFRFFRVSYQRK